MRELITLDEEVEVIWRAVNACPVCGEADRRHFYQQQKWGTMNINFWICRCGLVYADRHPFDDEELNKYYRDYYTPLTEGHWGVEGDGGLKAREEDRANRLMSGDLLDFEVTRHLDIGCGYGGLMKMVSEHFGCVSEGCDIRSLVDGYKVHKNLDEIDGTYDLVTCIHTLEHTTNPVGYLEAIRKICSKVLFIEVPSFAPLKGVLSPHHLFGFTTHTLFDILERTGFVVKEVGQAVHGTDEHNKVELQALAEVE